jgi:glutathione S-transferase
MGIGGTGTARVLDVCKTLGATRYVTGHGALDYLEKSPPALAPMIHAGHIALACALGYLDLRFAGRWRADHPNLVAWLDEFAWKVPAFAETKPE